MLQLCVVPDDEQRKAVKEGSGGARKGSEGRQWRSNERQYEDDLSCCSALCLKNGG